MSYRKQGVVCGIVSSLILALMIFAVSYCIDRGVSWQDTPFDLSPNYISFRAGEAGRVGVEEVIDAERDTDMVLISQYNGEDYMAMYDPAYYFYAEKTMDFPGSSRYFCRADYREKKPVGIYISNSDNLVNAHSEMKNAVTPLAEELLFSITPLSRLYKENTAYIINQMSLESLGDLVWIDSEDTEERERIKEWLLQAGYIIEDSGYTGKWDAFLDGLIKGRLYTKVVLVPVLSLYVIFLFTAFMYFINNGEVLKIHKLHGGTGMKAFVRVSGNFLWVNGAGSFLAVVLYGLLGGKFSTYLGFWDYLLAGAVHVGITGMAFYLGYFFYYRKGREWDAAK